MPYGPIFSGYNRDSTGKFIRTGPTIHSINDFTIIEYLFARGNHPSEIAIAIGLCSIDDSQQEKTEAKSIVNNYLNSKYRHAFEEAGMSFSLENLRRFLKSRFIGDDLYR